MPDNDIACVGDDERRLMNAKPRITPDPVLIPIKITHKAASEGLNNSPDIPIVNSVEDIIAITLWSFSFPKSIVINTPGIAVDSCSNPCRDPASAKLNPKLCNMVGNQDTIT